MLSEEEKKAIERLEKRIKDNEDYKTTQVWLTDDVVATQAVLSLIKEQQEREELIKEYVHQEIVHYTETIEDYEDDDKKENKDYIGQLKEEREHWKDIEKILQNKSKEELYMNWWRYG